MSWLNEFIHRWDAVVLELMPMMLRQGATPRVASPALPRQRYFSYVPDFCNVQPWEIPILELPIQSKEASEIVERARRTAEEL